MRRVFLTAAVICLSVADGVGEEPPALRDAKASWGPAFAVGPTYFAQSEIEKRIRTELERPAEFRYANNDLATIVVDLNGRHKIPVALDESALTADGINGDSKLSGAADGSPLRIALRGLLRPHRLTFAVRDDQLLITTQTAAESVASTRIYPIADLLTRIDEAGQVELLDADSLIELVSGSIDPETWREAGGVQGELRAFQTDGIFALVVTQTEEVHEKIEQLFAGLRKMKDPAVASVQRRATFGRSSTQKDFGDAAETIAPPIGAEMIVRASNELALSIYRHKAAEAKASQSFVFSSLGVVQTLAPLYAGAAGKTAQEFQQELQLPVDEAALTQLHDLNAWLMATPSERRYTLRNMTRLLVRPEERLLGSFVWTNQHYLGITPATLGSDDVSRRALIGALRNDAGSQLDPAPLVDAVDENTRLAVFNVIDFIGAWEKPFPVSGTTAAPFHGTTVGSQVEMMNTLEQLQYAERDGAQIVRKPYGGTTATGKTAMYVVLPSSEWGLARVESQLDGPKLDALLGAVKPAKVALALPKFDFQTLSSLAEMLQEIGLRNAFDPTSESGADFSGITGERGLFVEDVLQLARIRVNEFETRATAATAVVGAYGAAIEPEPIVEMRCDRPFLFVLRDETTGTILFMGRFAGPESAAPLGPDGH